MTRRQRSRQQVLVALRRIEDGATSRHVQPFVAVGYEEIRVCGGEVEANHSDALRAIDEADYPELFACLDQSFPWEDETGTRRDYVEDGRAGAFALRFELFDGVAELGQDLVVFKWVFQLDLMSRYLAAMVVNEIVSRLAAGLVHRREGDDDIPAVVVPDNIAQDGVHALGSIPDEDYGFDGRIHYLRDSGSRFIQEPRVLIANEPVRASLALVLILPELGVDSFWERAERAWPR